MRIKVCSRQTHWRQLVKEEEEDPMRHSVSLEKDRIRKREQYNKLKAKREKGQLNRDECMTVKENNVKHAEPNPKRKYHARNVEKKKKAAADIAM